RPAPPCRPRQPACPPCRTRSGRRCRPSSPGRSPRRHACSRSASRAWAGWCVSPAPSPRLERGETRPAASRASFSPFDSRALTRASRSGQALVPYLPLQPYLPSHLPYPPHLPYLPRPRRAGAGGVGFGGGAGRYSSITLLTAAIGRPGCVYVAAPSVRSTASFSPSRLTCSSSSGTSMVTDSVPVGATALTPPGPAPPLTRSTRSAAVRNSLCTTARLSSVLSTVSAPMVAV